MNNTFSIPIIPADEKQRKKALDELEILGSEEEGTFNHIAYMLAKYFNVPIALISFVDSEQVYFKANHGFNHKYADRGVSLCALAVLDNNVTFFEDAKNEPCLMANPLVQGEFGLQFYAGAPLRTREGYNVGTVCIVDKKQRFFSKEQSQMLEDFSKLIMDLIYLRLSTLADVKTA